MPMGKGTYGTKEVDHLRKKQKKERRSNMAKTVSWMWGGKRYKGTLIRETKTHKFARTHNGKVLLIELKKK